MESLDLQRVVMRTGLFAILLSVVAGVPAWAQKTLYPVPGEGGLGSMHIESTPSKEGHSRFFAERPQYRLRLGFPTDREGGYLPDTDANVVVLWFRIENISNQEIAVDTTKFTATDTAGRAYARLSADEGFDRLRSASGFSKSMLSRATQGVTMGRLGKFNEAEARDEARRFTLGPGQLSVPALAMKEGLIFFEAPSEKKFRINIGLGDLWSKPFVFTTEKPKK